MSGCLGVWDDHQWFRAELLSRKYSKQKLTNDALHKKHVSEKESGRWVAGWQHANALARACPDTHVISVSDREGDLYDLYHCAAQTQGVKADWLVRIKFTNRATLNDEGKRDLQALNERIMNVVPQQVVEFTLQEKGRSARTVTQALRLARLTLHPPTGRRGRLRCQPVTVTVLLAQEINPPEGCKPLMWWLMSSVPYRWRLWRGQLS